jgi:hypothetical protein
MFFSSDYLRIWKEAVKKIPFWHSPGETEVNFEKPLLGVPVTHLRFKPGISQMQV